MVLSGPSPASTPDRGARGRASPVGARAWRAEERPCPSCSSTSHAVLGRRGGRAHRAGLGLETTVVRCRACHLVYQRPFLLPVGNPYQDFSGEEYFHGHDVAAKVESGRALARRATSLLGRRGRVLELGCGRGELLRGAREEGWEVSGVDMTPRWATNEDLEVEIAPVESAESLKRKEAYDVVFLAAILEHLYAPGECLRRVWTVLKPDGLVFIDVPNECGLWSRMGNLYLRLRARDWAVNLSPTFPPFHVVGFCPRSLRHLLKEAGFSVRELELHRWQSALPSGEGFWAGLEGLGMNGVLTAGALIGMGAGITCWAQRRGT